MSESRLSKRGLSIPASPIRALMPLAEAAKAKGTRVFHLNIGQPDIEAPPEFMQGLKNLSSSLIGYEPSKGNQQLLNAWSRYLNRECNVSTEPKDFVITAGASEALLYAIVACTDPNDEILVFDPVYANYLGFAEMVSVKLKPVRTRIEESFNPPPIEEVTRAITPKTKALLICNPNNPTGALISKEQLLALLQLCEERNLTLIADETYREMVFDGLKPLSILQLAPKNQKIIVVDSFSKRFSLCGARIGCLVSPNPDFVTAAHRMASTRLAVSSVDQIAGAQLLESISPAFSASITKEFEKRRNVLYEELLKIEGAKVARPQGTFYTIVELPVDNSEAFVSFMLKDFSFDGETVFVAPGSGFYAEPNLGKNQVRIAYVLNATDLAKAMMVLREGLKAYRS